MATWQLYLQVSEGLGHVITALDHVIIALDHVIIALGHVITALDHVITALDHVIIALDHVITALDHVIIALDHVITVLDHVITASDHVITALDHVIHVQHWMCAYDWSVYSATAIKFMEKNRMGDQTLCSAFSPGKHTERQWRLLLKLNQQWYLTLLGGKFFVTGGTDRIIRVYMCIPGPPTLQAELTGHTVSKLTDRGRYFQSVQE